MKRRMEDQIFFLQRELESEKQKVQYYASKFGDGR